MDVEVTVKLKGEYCSVASGFVLPELLQRAFEPIDVCDDPLTQMITGGISEECAQIVMKMRKDSAEIIAKELADHLVKQMSKHDTSNGY